MRFGLALPHYDFSLPGLRSIDWPFVRDWAQRAEELGFDSVWISDHLSLDLGKYGGPAEPRGTLECFTTLAALAVAVKKVRLGTLVACNDLRSPVLVARMAATLHLISGGRFELGMWAGWYVGDYLATGFPFDPPRVRIERLAEAVQIILGMLSSPSAFSFTGRHYRVREACNLPAPAGSPRPSVWVGGKGDRVVAVAGRYADGFNTVWAATPESYGGRIEHLERAALAAGRDPRALRRSLGLYALPGADQAELSGRWNRYLAANPGIGSGVRLEDWAADKLSGPPEAMAERIRAFQAAGVEEVI
ncbi:MAG: LLM class flavin-dependent oxidoreductase, partial [Acidimicrobiales bacterium]